MQIAYIDYTPFFYTSVAGKPQPPVTTGKFVQILNGNTMHLVLSPKEFTKYHAHIVERFCMDKGIEGSWDTKGERFFIHDTAWEVLGGGKFERDVNRKAIKLYDNSMAFGKFRSEGLKESLGSVPDLSGYTIVIE